MNGGLLDFIKSPEGQGLLAAGFGGLAGARRGNPMNAIGAAGLAGMQGYSGAQDRAQRLLDNKQTQELREQQLLQAKYANEQMANDRKLNDLAAQFYRPEQKGWSAMPADDAAGIQAMPARDATPAGFDKSGFLAAAHSVNPTKAAALAKTLQGDQEWKEVKRFDKDNNIIHGLINIKSANPAATFQPIGGEAERQKLQFSDRGGAITPLNPFTGQVAGADIAKTASPDTVMQVGATTRGQNMVDARSREANAQAATSGKAPAGYRYLPNGDMEAVPGGPADLKAQAAAGLKATGASDVDSAIASLRSAYDRLESGGGITSTNKGALSNAAAAMGSSGAGQMVGRTLGTQNQSARNDIAMTRPALLAALMKATGMSAKQMDSNAELKLWMTTATDPTLDVESNRRALDSIERKYLGQQSQAKPNAAKMVNFGDLK